MAIWTRQSGTNLTPKLPYLFREETRKWYVRLEKSGLAVTAKIYDTLTDANAGNANYAASGSASITAAGDVTVSLTNNVAVPPTFTNASLVANVASVGVNGNEVWTCDLGTRIARTPLRILRSFSLISVANGYFFNLTKAELGLSQWEDVTSPNDLTPYVGVGALALRSEPREVGQFSLTTTLDVQCVAHVKNASSEVVSDVNVLHFFHDLRRALRAAMTTTYDGAVNDGTIFNDGLITAGEPDLGIEWARDRGTINFQVTCTIQEDQSEIVGG